MKRKVLLVTLVVSILFVCLFLLPTWHPASSAMNNNSISLFLDTGLFNGGLAVAEDGWLVSYTFIGSLVISGIPSSASVSDAYLYLSFWQLEPGYWSVTFNGYGLGDPYTNRIGLGYFTQLVSCRIDVKSCLSNPGNGNYGITVSYNTGSTSFYGAALVVVYSDSSSPQTRIIIQDGARTIRDDIPGSNPYTVQFTGISTPPQSATLWAMGQGGSSAVPGEQDELRVNGYLLDGNAFKEAGGQAWDCNSWPIQQNWIQSTTNVDFYGPTSDGYAIDFVILYLTYPTQPPQVPEFSLGLLPALWLTLTIVIVFIAKQKRLRQRKS